MILSFLVAFILVSFRGCINVDTSQKLIFFVGPNKSPLNAQNGSKTNPFNDLNYVLNNVLGHKSTDISIVLTGNRKRKQTHQEISSPRDLFHQNIEIR